MTAVEHKHNRQMTYYIYRRRKKTSNFLALYSPFIKQIERTSGLFLSIQITKGKMHIFLVIVLYYHHYDGCANII